VVTVHGPGGEQLSFFIDGKTAPWNKLAKGESAMPVFDDEAEPEQTVGAFIEYEPSMIRR
jgi:hypothetical protein